VAARDDDASARAPEPEDLARICRALNEAGARYVLVGDLMGKACGLTYEDLAGDVESRDVLGVPVPVASAATLIRTKDTYRPQDAIDRAFLEGLTRGAK